MDFTAIIANARNENRAALDELDGKQLLASFGVNVPKSVVVSNASGAAQAVATLRPPLVVKVMSPDILHKSDAGGVKIGLHDAADVEQAIAAYGVVACDQARARRRLSDRRNGARLARRSWSARCAIRISVRS